MLRGDDIALATFERACDAEETDDVGVVGVEELTGGGTVDPDFVDLGGVGARVFDMPEDVTKAILRDKVAKISSKTHVSDCGLVVTPLLDGEAFEEQEAFAVDNLFAESVEEGFHFGKRVFGLGLGSDESI